VEKERKLWAIESMSRAVKAVRDNGLIEGFENIQCTKSNTERNWRDFSLHSTDNSSQRIGKERNGGSALNVANGAMGSVHANVKPRLSSPAVAVSINSDYYDVSLKF
jgi:hypothetical protein